MTDEQLVDEFGNACLRAGGSNSGLCISPSASSDWDRMKKLQAELKARLAKLNQRILANSIPLIHDPVQEVHNVDVS